MSNYDLFKSGVNSHDKYQVLSDKVYGKTTYTREDLVH